MKFPFILDVERLQAEVAAFSEDDWIGHLQGFEGNSALPLVHSVDFGADAFVPPFQMSHALRQSPYMRQVINSFETIIGRSRLMRLAPGAKVPPHVDIRYYWRNRTRVHIPIITQEDIIFTCRDQTVHMAAGEAWTFDNWQNHHVNNPTDIHRVHLVFDTCGTASFWRLLEPDTPQITINWDPSADANLILETTPPDGIFSASEIENICRDMIQDVEAFEGNAPQRTQALAEVIDELRYEWRTIELVKGRNAQSAPYYSNLISQFLQRLKLVGSGLKLASNGKLASLVLSRILSEAVTLDQAPAIRPSTVGGSPPAVQVPTSADPNGSNSPKPSTVFDRPIFIIAAPRSGSTWFFETLSPHPEVCTIGGEGHQHIEKIPGLAPQHRQFDSNRLSTEDATPDVSHALKNNYLHSLRDASGNRYKQQNNSLSAFRFLEKTPKNALRIPFLKKIFPDARFIFLYRDGRQNVSSMMDAWKSGRFVTYPRLPGWTNLPWSLALVPNWQNLIGLPLAAVAVEQWARINLMVIQDLAEMPASDVLALSYEDLRSNRRSMLEKSLRFADLPVIADIIDDEGQRLSKYTVTPPNPDKWKRHETSLSPYMSRIDEVDNEIRRRYSLEIEHA
ncbi:MAG: sulfotransferase [Pseudomonadota bacterium]